MAQSNLATVLNLDFVAVKPFEWEKVKRKVVKQQRKREREREQSLCSVSDELYIHTV